MRREAGTSARTRGFDDPNRDEKAGGKDYVNRNVAVEAAQRLIEQFCGGSVEDFLVGLVDIQVLEPKQLRRRPRRLPCANRERPGVPAGRGRSRPGGLSVSLAQSRQHRHVLVQHHQYRRYETDAEHDRGAAN
jgi:hypothetical protein